LSPDSAPRIAAGCSKASLADTEKQLAASLQDVEVAAAQLAAREGKSACVILSQRN
jgi:hypothetical protein